MTEMNAERDANLVALQRCCDKAQRFFEVSRIGNGARGLTAEETRLMRSVIYGTFTWMMVAASQQAGAHDLLLSRLMQELAKAE